MRRTAEWFVEEARRSFLTDGTHVELFFLFREDGSYSMGPPPPDMPKDQFAAVLRQRIRDDNTFGVVHIVEAWVYVPKRVGDHTARQLEAGEMRVTDLRREERTEALVVRYECRDRAQRMWISPIVRTKDGVALADALEMGETVEGRFGSLFGE
jgi:hypothetical protein